MFSEYEVDTFVKIPAVSSAVQELKKDFIITEAKFLELSDHDFLSLALMTPAVAIANANNNISLFEEIALNKMARKMSKGGYFLKSDPVERGMKFLIKGFDKWEEKFLNLLKLVMHSAFSKSTVHTTITSEDEISFERFPLELMHVPFILVRFMTAFFLQGQTEIVEEHKISQVEYEKIVELGNKLDIADLNVFKAFCTTFKIK